MKTNNLILLFLFSFCFQATNYAQITDLSAEEVFEKVIQHYDPNGVWSSFEGSMHMYTFGPNWAGEEDLFINNASGYYKKTKYLPDGTSSSGMENEKVFYELDGKALASSESPRSLLFSSNYFAPILQ